MDGIIFDIQPFALHDGEYQAPGGILETYGNTVMGTFTGASPDGRRAYTHLNPGNNPVGGELEDAQKHPEKYQNLIVRVGGFSERFVNLPAETQREIFSRTLNQKNFSPRKLLYLQVK